VRPGASRFFVIATLECAWQTWKLRCKRVIRGEQGEAPRISQNEDLNTFRAAMNERLSQDRILTNKKKYHDKALPERLVLHTWSGNLEYEERLPVNWLKSNGVLIYRTPRGHRSPTQCGNAFPRGGNSPT
jgi:hypothetical protein